MTIGEERFAEIYPDAVYVDTWYDFDFTGTKVEVKDCFRPKGRYVVFMYHHEQLMEENGWYFFVLKRRSPNGKGPPTIQYVKWVPATGIYAYKYGVRSRKSHLDEYIEREVFDIPWKAMWTDVHKLDRRANSKLAMKANWRKQR